MSKPKTTSAIEIDHDFEFRKRTPTYEHRDAYRLLCGISLLAFHGLLVAVRFEFVVILHAAKRSTVSNPCLPPPLVPTSRR